MRASRGERILFGHWSTLGFLLAEDFCALDTGCLWGGRLTALRLDGETKRIDQPCQGALRNL
jgi:bis(5'-nucleosyl)-tetraphosphatase (symmetrical)